jgi:acetyl-CoA synthetase
LYAFIILNPQETMDPDHFEAELNALLRRDIGSIARLEGQQITPQLPKTRSGKIMRRLLRKIAQGDIRDQTDYALLGDTSTLLDARVIDELVRTFQEKT